MDCNFFFDTNFSAMSQGDQAPSRFPVFFVFSSNIRPLQSNMVLVLSSIYTKQSSRLLAAFSQPWLLRVIFSMCRTYFSSLSLSNGKCHLSCRSCYPSSWTLFSAYVVLSIRQVIQISVVSSSEIFYAQKIKYYVAFLYSFLFNDIFLYLDNLTSFWKAPFSGFYARSHF